MTNITIVWGRRLAVLALGVATLAAGGCSSVKKADYDAALAENTQLREELSQREAELATAQERADGLERQLRTTSGELEQARAKPASFGSPGDTGFEGIGGTSVQRLAGGAIVVEVAGDVLFDSGSVTLKSSSRQALDRISSVIQSRYRNNIVRVEGYTDTDPIRKSKWKSNERLSSERALAVEEYLVKKGVDGDRIYAAAFGPANAKSSKRESRRVEIVILDSAS